ncbi:cation transport regulator ChaB [filamentous cyanobacterium CCP5]|nr:cation transport regulator ChaB [filamentous cyanobacterium CCP5]
MAYENLEQLPQEVKELTSEGQKLFMTAFNASVSDGLSDEKAHDVAWNSVKNSFAQDAEGNWQFKAGMREHDTTTGTIPHS